MSSKNVQRIGSLIFVPEKGGRSAHFKHKIGLVSDGHHLPPDDQALHLDGCECGQGQVHMDAKTYQEKCFMKRLDDSGKVREVPLDVKESLIGVAVEWPKRTYHPLVCPYASAYFDPNSTLEEGEIKCACWEFNLNIKTDILTESSGIFVERPNSGLEEPELGLRNADIFEIEDSDLGFTPSIKSFRDGLSGYILEFDKNGIIYEKPYLWIFCNSHNLEIDESQQHLLLLTKKSCIDYLDNFENGVFERRLRRLMKTIERPWLKISNEEVVPMWYYGKNMHKVPREMRRFFGLFEEFKGIIGSDYAEKETKTSTTIIKKALGIRLYNDVELNMNYKPRDPLQAKNPFWLQINFLLGVKESLDAGNEISLEIRQLGSDDVLDRYAFELERSAVQVWLRNSKGLDAGYYYAMATARSSSDVSQSYPLGIGFNYFRVA